MLGILLICATLTAAVNAAKACVANNIPPPKVFGAEILDVSAKEVRDSSDWALPIDMVAFKEVTSVSYCNVTVTYTHPGWNDTVHVDVVLPLNDWNGRFVGQGGGGFCAGQANGGLSIWASQGYASATTDTGHDKENPASGLTVWDGALTSPGNVNLHLLEDFSWKALGDLPQIGKQVVEAFYGQKAKYSYWNGCSTGGRQGLVAAQRFPDAYDGILSVAPAANWATFLVTMYYLQHLMNRWGVYPPTCEFHAITAAAIEACDELDGVKDGIVSAPGLCTFDAGKVVGTKIDCEGKTRKVSKEAAAIAKAAWEGPIDSHGKRWWYGLTHETSLHLTAWDMIGGIAGTKCDDSGKCKGYPFPISVAWIRTFLARDPDYDLTKMTDDDFFEFIRQSKRDYFSTVDTSEADLSAFQKAGGKLIMWHGLADQLIFPNGSLHYYKSVLAHDGNSNVYDWFRYFEAPGVAHCAGGTGPFPLHALNSLEDWVEKGKAPDHLDAQTKANPFADGPVLNLTRPLCPWPKVAAYKGGDANDASSFECADSFHAFGKTGTATAAAAPADATFGAEKDEL